SALGVQSPRPAQGWPVTSPEYARALPDHQNVARLARHLEVDLISRARGVERVEPRPHLNEIVDDSEHVDRVPQLLEPCHLDHPKTCACRWDGRAPSARAPGRERPRGPWRAYCPKGTPSRRVVERGTHHLRARQLTPKATVTQGSPLVRFFGFPPRQRRNR